MAFNGNIAIASSIKDILVKEPTILNTTITLANTEYTIIIPQPAKRFALASRSGRLKVRYVSGGNFRTVHYGTTYSEENLGLAVNLSIYVESTKPADIIELIYWE